MILCGIYFNLHRIKKMCIYAFNGFFYVYTYSFSAKGIVWIFLMLTEFFAYAIMSLQSKLNELPDGMN